MQYLIFQLQGAMASWGEAAVGEYRGSHDYPTVSALAGLLAASLGLRREQEAELQAVHAGYLFGVGIYDTGTLLRDYQTVQVPSRSLLKGRRHATRKDELAFPRAELNTILSNRDHRQSVDYLVAVQSHPQAPYPLEALQHALREPVFVPYLGRKSCPLGAPLAPRLLDADNVLAAFSQYPRGVEAMNGAPERMAWPEGMDAGFPPHWSITKRDRLIHRGAWQYGERTEHLATLAKGV